MFNIIKYPFILIIISTFTFAGDCLSDCDSDQLATLEEFAENIDDNDLTEQDVIDFCEWWLEQDDNGCALDCDDEVLSDLDEITNACFEVIYPECITDCGDVGVLYDFLSTEEPSDSDIEEFCSWWNDLDDQCTEDCDAQTLAELDKISEACSDDGLPECLSECDASQIETLEEFAENADDLSEEEVEDFCEWWLEQDDNGCADDCDDEVLSDLDGITNACFQVLTPECLQDCPEVELEVLYDFLSEDDLTEEDVEEFCSWWDDLDGDCADDCDEEVTAELDKISKFCGHFLGVNVFADKFLINTIYPNPFNPVTTIAYEIPNLSYVSIKVYDLSGRVVADLLSKVVPGGNHIVNWDASDQASGVYFVKMIANGSTDSQKVMLLK